LELAAVLLLKSAPPPNALADLAVAERCAVGVLIRGGVRHRNPGGSVSGREVDVLPAALLHPDAVSVNGQVAVRTARARVDERLVRVRPDPREVRVVRINVS